MAKKKAILNGKEVEYEEESDAGEYACIDGEWTYLRSAKNS
jgi:hypothetical protein